MKKPHCDRCDAVIDRMPYSAIEISRTIMEDKGVDRDIAQVRVETKVLTFDGHDWVELDLCPACFEPVWDAAQRQRRADTAAMAETQQQLAEIKSR